jgi:hypothetical protein
MRRGLLALLAAAVLSVLVVLDPADHPSMAAEAPVHTLSVSGTGVAMYPAFEAGTERYGITTTGATGGSVHVTATTSDPAGSVWVDGRRATGDTAGVTGLTAGDEISVLIEDSAGTAVHSLVYLPAQFPALSVVGSGAPAGHVLLTLSKFTAGTPNFETAVDRAGVPVYVRSSTDGSLDLKRLADGHYTVSREPATAGKTGSALVELDDQFRQVASYETAAPLVNTDGHDSILRPDGSRILIAYEPNPQTSKTDAMIQEVNQQGAVVFTWNSKDHVLPSDGVGDAKDYAHINSIVVMDDGDILASFRHLSQVLKIAWTARDGIARGDVVWRLGGRRSDFTFVDDPYPGGPCAQHTATELPNGHILMFDNGSFASAGPPLVTPMCIDPTNPTGPTVARPQTRVTEYALDTATHTATLVWSYQVPGWFTIFAGSAQRLENGDTLVGWAAARNAVATEVDAAGVRLWELSDSQEVSQRYFTYRAAVATVPDAIAPELDVLSPAQDASYALGAVVTSDFGCTDRGGSSLVSCQEGAARSGDLLDTTVPGSHTFTVRATDGSGNVTSVTRTYHVAAAEPTSSATPTPTAAPAPTPSVTPVRHRPDGVIRRSDGRWAGDNIYGNSVQQGVQRVVTPRENSTTVIVRWQNEGSRSDRVRVLGAAGSAAFRVRYYAGGEEVTRRVTAGTYRTPSLLPGQSSRLVVRVTRTAAAEAGDQRTVRVRGTSVGDDLRWDAVRAVVRAKR